MSMAELGLLGGVLVTLLIAASLALAETSLTHVGRVKALSLVEDDRKGAPALLRLVEDPARFLNVVLLLILIVQVLGASLATLFAERVAGEFGWILSSLVLTAISFVFAEAAPKTFAIQHAERVALRVAPAIAALIKIPGLQGMTKVLVTLSNVVTPGKGLARGPFVTEEEIRTMAQVAADESSIEQGESEMIHSIFEFGDTVVREVMVPRPDIVGVDADESIDEALTQMLKHGFSRMPVLDPENDNDVVGLIYAKDIFRKLHAKKPARNGKNGKTPAGKPKLRDLMRKAEYVPDSKKVADLLREMQAKKTHMMIVVDEYGDLAGLVTLEDLLEEIVGEISDEYDRDEPDVRPLDDSTLIVNARLQIDELNELLDVELPNTEWDTVGGLMAGLLGKVPSRGEEVTYGGLAFKAERVQGRRIAKVRITKNP